MMSKCDKNRKKAHKALAIAECVTDVLAIFYDQLLNRHMATLSICAIYQYKRKKTVVNDIIYVSFN